MFPQPHDGMLKGPTDLVPVITAADCTFYTVLF